MTARLDDDALAWDGDDDPTLDVGAVPVRSRDTSTDSTSNAVPAAPVGLPEGFTAVGKGSDAIDASTEDESTATPAVREPMGNATLISLGVLGGIYLLYAIGWLIGANRLTLIAQLFLDPIAFQATLWLAVLAPPIWFVTVFVLTRGSRAWVRFALLAVGVVVLIPWPFVLAGAAL